MGKRQSTGFLFKVFLSKQCLFTGGVTAYERLGKIAEKSEEWCQFLAKASLYIFFRARKRIASGVRFCFGHKSFFLPV